MLGLSSLASSCTSLSGNETDLANVSLRAPRVLPPVTPLNSDDPLPLAGSSRSHLPPLPPVVPAAPHVAAVPPSAAAAPAAPRSFAGLLTAAALQLRAVTDVSTLSADTLEAAELLRRELEHLELLVQRSRCTVEGVWVALEREGALPQMGREIYERLLIKDPHYASLFSGTDMGEQSDVIIRMIGSIIGFTNKPEMVVALAQKLGARHRGYGVPEDAFPDMATAFMAALERRLSPATMAESRPAWERLWGVVLEQMSYGYRSEMGERGEKQYTQSRAEVISRFMHIIDDQQAGLPARKQFVGIMYADTLEKHPELGVKFVALRDLRVAQRVFRSIAHIAYLYGRKEELESYMMELGARHSAYNVTDAEMRLFQPSFVYACKHFLREKWSAPLETNFTEFYSFMTDGIVRGMGAGKTTGVNAHAPSSSDPFCLMFTDIENSTKLWQVNGAAMGEAVKQHHRMIRVLIAEYGAYEVKTVGDSFIIACKDMLTGAKIALGIQLELMRCAPIAEGFQMVEPCEGGGDPDAWDPRTLRVRIGMEYCTEATPTYDTIHRRYDYYGTSVNRCARVEAAACGGQILLSRQTFEALMAVPEFHTQPAPGPFRTVAIPSPSKQLDGRGLDHFVSVEDMGMTHLKGLSEPVHLLSMVPSCLAGRRFKRKVDAL